MSSTPRTHSRVRILVALTAVMGALALPGSAHGIVGGSDAADGEYPEMADIQFGVFSCGGTLIDPTHVLSAGHCSSATGAAVASPASWPTPLIDVRLGSNAYGEGEPIPVSKVTISPEYLGLTNRNDIAILELSRPATQAPTKVASASERSTWEPGDLETITGWGATEEGGSGADRLQEARVPITTDQYCADAYGSSFDAATMVCAGYPEGGVDTCQGDSGGPMFGHTSGGARRVVGVTSWGEGCAQAGKPGVYARVADDKLRNWIRSVAPGGVALRARRKRR